MPGIQADHVIFDEPRQAPLFSADDPSYLVVGETDSVFAATGTGCRRMERKGSDDAGCVLLRPRHAGRGISSGTVMFIDPDGTDDAEIVRFTDGSLDDMRLWQSADGAIMAFAKGTFYRIESTSGGIRSPRHLQDRVPWPCRVGATPGSQRADHMGTVRR